MTSTFYTHPFNHIIIYPCPNDRTKLPGLNYPKEFEVHDLQKLDKDNSTIILKYLKRNEGIDKAKCLEVRSLMAKYGYEPALCTQFLSHLDKKNQHIGYFCRCSEAGAHSLNRNWLKDNWETSIGLTPIRMDGRTLANGVTKDTEDPI
ncbi:hypothetical protein BBP40_003101 [Aspergillus hancockii]|nr:hypothetical protein BBP40_003101 [Aspergillus hancockii]